MTDPLRTRVIKVGESEALSIYWYCLDGTEYHQLLTCPPASTRQAKPFWQSLDNPTNPKHGVDCPKKPHTGGELHGEDDDTPYDVDGCTYCGRCHTAL